jgi:predicted nucleic acid-binding protein
MSVPVACVVDASVAVKLFLAEPLAAEAHALFALLADPLTVFHVPDLFYAECGNIFWKCVQRGDATPAEVAVHLSHLAGWRLQRTATFDLISDALAIAITHGLTAYDACYVALAQRGRVPLITADQRLERRLAGSGYAVIWLGSWTPPTPAGTPPSPSP